MAETTAETKKEAPKRMGRPSVIADAIPQFVESVRTVEDGYEDLWQREWDERISGKALSTRSAYVSRYRTAIKEALGDRHPALAFIKVLESRDEPLRTAPDRRSNAGRKPTRREAIETFVQQVQALDKERQAIIKAGKKTQKQADYLYRRQLAKLWKAITDDWRGRIESTTVLANTSLFRNALREAKLADEDTLSVVVAPKDIQQAVSETYRDSVIEQHNELIAVPHWRDLVDTARDALPKTDASWSKLEEAATEIAAKAQRGELVRYGVALGLLTGRRPYEVFCQGAIAPMPLMFDQQNHVAGRGYETWRVLFSGQSKTRGREGTQFETSFAIPVLAPAKEIVLAWTVLRMSEDGQIWRQMSNEEFKNDLLRLPNTLFRDIRTEMFAPLWPAPALDDSKNATEGKRLTANNLRALYAEIADQFFRPKSKSKAAFFAEVLGHTEKDIETATAYMKYYLPDQKTAGPTKRVKGRLAQKQAERLEKLGLSHDPD